MLTRITSLQMCDYSDLAKLITFSSGCAFKVIVLVTGFCISYTPISIVYTLPCPCMVCQVSDGRI